MTNNKTIDILIPAYNAHKTIVKTLASIFSQQRSFIVKVYIINDGSNDDYSEVIELFKDLDIIELKLDCNKGVGVARQYGLEHSYGDYILFIDADDVLYNNFALSNLYNLIKNYDYDFVYGAIYLEDKNGREKIKFHEGCLHGKMYNRSFLKNNNIRFNSTRTSEDNSFNHICMFKARRVNNTDKVIYVYKDNTSSLTKGLSIEKIYNNLKDFTENVVYFMDNVGNIKDERIVMYYFNSYSFVYNNYIKYKDEIIAQDILELLRKLESKKTEYRI